MFDLTFRHRQNSGSPQDRSDSRLRLDDVIARARGRPTEFTEPTETDEPDDGSGNNPGRLRNAMSARGGRLVERWVPASVAGAAARQGRRGKGVIAVATAAVVALLTGAFILADRPVAQRPATPPALPVAELAATTTTTPPPSTTPSTVVISVVGHVAEPGLVTLPAGARVADALAAVGGVDDPSDRRTVNLARHIVDGEQLYIGVPVPAAASRPPGRKAASGTAQAAVNINTAGAEALAELPEVGEVTAKRIIEWREQHGGFDTVEQLRQVDGIGPKTFAELRELVRTQ